MINRVPSHSKLTGAIVAGSLAIALPASGELVSYYNFDSSDNADQVGSNDGQVNSQSGYCRMGSVPNATALGVRSARIRVSPAMAERLCCDRRPGFKARSSVVRTGLGTPVYGINAMMKPCRELA